MSRPWRNTLINKCKKEIETFNLLPTNAPILIKTAMGRNGTFELGWDLDLL
ncbi:hypothetical protein [Gloeothece verrucosa]|uniref:Uncharacterized protein n=1 Tax=Gloeothece verrucosa (strain PCC 7822) TaxID=497965 RepID=E0UDY2_GLOV7|nr:hypothetical protein [Gloeothece verrucosa]ADN12986.1 hypothetical protein Cyan7822_0975 [Gloeothece verrucosa PCC 7822]